MQRNIVHRWITIHRRSSGIITACITGTIAVVYYVIVPEKAYVSEGIVRLVLQYGHSLCWVLLTAAVIGWTFKRSGRAVKVFAYGGLATYILFMTTLLFG